QHRSGDACPVRGLPEAEPDHGLPGAERRRPRSLVQAVPGVGSRARRAGTGAGTRTGTGSGETAALKRFRAKWKPVRVKKTRQSKKTAHKKSWNGMMIRKKRHPVFYWPDPVGAKISRSAPTPFRENTPSDCASILLASTNSAD